MTLVLAILSLRSNRTGTKTPNERSTFLAQGLQPPHVQPEQGGIDLHIDILQVLHYGGQQQWSLF